MTIYQLNTMNRLLYIGKRINKPTGGADQVNLRNQRLLEKLFSDKVDYVPSNMTSISDKLIFGVNHELIIQVRESLRTNNYSYVFISQSLMGRIARVIKREFPQIMIILFFHNIEVQYASEYLKTNGLKALPFYLAARYWEKIGCRYADRFITLNERDSSLLRQYYNRQATIELPTTFKDMFDLRKALKSQQIKKSEEEIPIDYLFVGVSFFANVHGAQWFIDKVMPNVKGHLHIIGKGMDQIHFKHLTDRIHIHGFVDDLAVYYYRARMVIIPIFVGGGMKTKTAEALMYGKSILGTTEAFEGYKVNSHCMILCNTASDYVQAINAIRSDNPLINEESRILFKTQYSDEIALRKLSTIFQYSFLCK